MRICSGFFFSSWENCLKLKFTACSRFFYMEGSLYSFTPREAMRLLELKQQNNKQTKIPKAKRCSSSALHSQGPRLSWRNTKKSSQRLLEKAFPTVLTLVHPLHSRLCYRLISSYMSCSLHVTLCIKIVSKTEYKNTIMGTQQRNDIALSSWNWDGSKNIRK